MKKIILLFLLMPFLVNGQENEEGVRFLHSITNWSDIVKKAQKEDKYIFVDCYTTWCGPCKYVSKQVFPKKNVGDFYNEHFVSISLQMDETSNDNEDVLKSRYIAQSINEKYPITAYPTFLIFNKSGMLVHKFIGAGNDSMMIVKAKNAIDENKQYYTLLDKYKDGNKDSILYKNIIYAGKDAGVNVELYLFQYLQSTGNIFTLENGNNLVYNVNNTNSVLFDYLFLNKDVWEKILNK